MEARGKVIRTRVAPGSKSDRAAVVLITDKGDYILRRSGANAFVDPKLDELVGKSLKCEGTLHGQYFLMDSWTEIGEM